MTEYAVLLSGREDLWENATPEERDAIFARHREFAEALAARGHAITGGAELAHSREARTVRRVAGGLRTTQGPYAESVEQLGGFYLVRSDDLDDLLDCVGVLVGSEAGIEVRPTVPQAEHDDRT